jgi:ankyrin repeat protein
MYAASNNNLEIAQLLISRGAIVNPPIGKAGPLVEAIRQRNWRMARLLLDAGATIHCQDPLGDTPLCLASQGGCFWMVRHCLDHGAIIEHRNKNGDTPLLLATNSSYFHLEIVELLLQRGASVDARGGTDGCTPLYLAAFYGRLEFARLLLDHGADINSQNHNGETPLLRATNKKHWELVELLLGRGADFEHRNSAGRSPLECAMEGGAPEIVYQLVKAAAQQGRVDGIQRER